MKRDAHLLASLALSLAALSLTGCFGEEEGEIPQYCPAVEAWPDTMTICRVDEDCPIELPLCEAKVTQVSGCGACMSFPYECEDDASCGDGQICVDAESGSCVCDPGSMCQPSCVTAGCAADERCGDNGRCAPRPCTDGYACPEDYECDPTADSRDKHGCAPLHCRDGRFACLSNLDCNIEAGGHGCVRRACERDADCDCGACVDKLCRDRPAICTEYPYNPP